MKLWKQLLVLTLIDTIIIWLWVRQQDPDPSVSIGIVLFVPGVAILNLIIAAILFATKKEYAKVFLINSVISAIIMYNLFLAGINRHQQLRHESWQFIQNDTVFRVTHNKLDSTFDISFRTNTSTSTEFMNGQVAYNRNNIILKSDTLKFIIKSNFLFGFQGKQDSIKLLLL